MSQLLAIGSAAGIWFAVNNYGAWAIVWQSVAAAAIKSIILWMSGNWLPMLKFSFTALRSYFSVGSGMMLTSFLNTLFQKIYSFFIGNRAGLVSLGYYTQSEKWSTMGVASLSQIITASFLPLMSQMQDDRSRFARIASKTNRFTCYLLFPSVGILVMTATPLFHL
ncbi:MAG: oligosaccharide flippase family protein, partial [Muribaculaceae bacterium]|nr:oligosaccharide flippase family protein [Muribaculaceae bacterium]